MREELFLDITEAARILGVNPETLRRWDNEKILPATRINQRGDRRWLRSDIVDFLQKERQKAVLVYKDYEVIANSKGFEGFPNRFATIAKYILRKGDKNVGMVFSASGMEVLKRRGKDKVSLEELAQEKIKTIIDSTVLYDEDIFTFEFRNCSFVHVRFPDWWEEPPSMTLTKGLRLCVRHEAIPIAKYVDAWRSYVVFKTKTGYEWLITPFGPEGKFTEYLVEVSAEYLEDYAKLPPTPKGAAVFALDFVNDEFDKTKDKNGNRNIKRITTDKVACWKGSCKKGELITTQIDSNQS